MPQSEKLFRNGVLLLSLDSPLFSKGAIHFGLGAESIAGHVQKTLRIVPKHIDLQIDHGDALKKAKTFIETRKPEIIGISTKIGSLDNLDAVLNMLCSVRQADAGYRPKIVFGGVYATFAAEELFNIAADKLGACERGNIYIVGRQGEFPFVRLIQQDFQNVSVIANVMYYDLEADRLVSTEKTRVPLKFERIGLPTTQTVSDVLDHNGMIWAEFSRGCQSFCTFCSIKELRGGRDLEERPASLVIKNLEALVEVGVRSVAFADDDFPLMSENAQNFAQRMISLGLNKKLSFSISTRSTNIIRPGDDDSEKSRKLDCFRVFAEAGLKDVFIGLESFSPPQLKRYGILPLGKSTKGEKKQADANAQVVELLEHSGVTLVAGFIPIDPLMTDIDELGHNLSMLKDSKMYRHVTNPLHVMRVQVGTAYENLAKHAGLVTDGHKTDLVFYDSDYASEIIEIIAQISGNWNARKGSTDYALKTLRFSAFSDRQKFEEAQNTMEEIRLIDLDFGLAMCHAAKAIPTRIVNAERQDVRVKIADGFHQRLADDLAAVVADFERKRSSIFRSFLQFDFIDANREIKRALLADIEKSDTFVERLNANSDHMLEDKAFLGKRDKRSIEAVIA